MSAHILLVDDDVWVLKMLRTVLEKHGYAIETALNGADALERVELATPDLIITDVTMPKMDGWTLVKILRSRQETAFTPVIFLSAMGSDEDRIQGFRLGADDYMQKPFHFQEFDLRVRAALRRGKASQEQVRRHVSSPPSEGVHGQLEQLGLSSLLIMMEMEKKSGVLRLKRSDESAELILTRGRIVSAKVAGAQAATGALGVYRLLTWGSGQFQFSLGDTDHVPDELNSSTTHLLMEGARLMDEANRNE